MANTFDTTIEQHAIDFIRLYLKEGYFVSAYLKENGWYKICATRVVKDKESEFCEAEPQPRCPKCGKRGYIRSLESMGVKLKHFDEYKWKCTNCNKYFKEEPKDEPQTERSACDTCQWYNSGIPCGVEPSVCKRAVEYEPQTERSE